jgi:hypothetical protein
MVGALLPKHAQGNRRDARHWKTTSEAATLQFNK